MLSIITRIRLAIKLSGSYIDAITMYIYNGGVLRLINQLCENIMYNVIVHNTVIIFSEFPGFE